MPGYRGLAVDEGADGGGAPPVAAAPAEFLWAPLIAAPEPRLPSGLLRAGFSPAFDRTRAVGGGGWLGRGAGARRSRGLPLGAAHRRTGLQVTLGSAAGAALLRLRQDSRSDEKRGEQR